MNANSLRVSIRDNIFTLEDTATLSGAGVWINSPCDRYICRDNRYYGFTASNSAAKEVLPNGTADYYGRGELTLRLDGQPGGGETGMTLLLDKGAGRILAKVKVGNLGSAGTGRRALYIDN